MKELPQLLTVMIFGWLVFNFVIPIKIHSQETTLEFTSCPKVYNINK
jgi:hypothetical protein